MKKEAPNKFCKHFEKKTEYSAESSDIRAEEKRREKNRLGTIYLLGERNRCLRNNQSLSVSWKVSNSICLSACLPACLPARQMLTSNAYPDKRKTKHEHFMQKRMSKLPCFDFLKQVIHHSLANATTSYLSLFMPFVFSLLSISNEINPLKPTTTQCKCKLVLTEFGFLVIHSM
jgi:hypothetical protein